MKSKIKENWGLLLGFLLLMLFFATPMILSLILK